MPLKIKITPLRTGTTQPADVPKLFPCPPHLEYDQILPFLIRFFGTDPIEHAWTTTSRHAHLNMGWIFPSMPTDNGQPMDHFELLCVPVIEGEDEMHKPLFELLADQQQDSPTSPPETRTRSLRDEAQ
jgi:hypothetical protein